MQPVKNEKIVHQQKQTTNEIQSGYQLLILHRKD